MPVVGLVRLRRALVGVIPTFDPIRQVPGGIGRHGHGRTGDCANPDRHERVEIPLGGGSEGSNHSLARGLLRAS
ncbi:hypothetical protein FHR87_003866 [Azomonas macrocytogenes]|uniref:Uncharacterized protein n=1 Tax=Azomonas macrocytogenes TaxID=69962 RepID=A0A839T8K3_AZOMA|nr:hypothetical protein [Azomonas macrocytogenes]